MSKKGGQGGVGGIKSATETRGVDKTEAVKEVTGVQPTAGVGGVRGPGGVGRRRSTRVMTIEEREALLHMISEEADKMFADGQISKEKKELVTSAVKMAVDAGLLPDEEVSAATKKK